MISQTQNNSSVIKVESCNKVHFPNGKVLVISGDISLNYEELVNSQNIADFQVKPVGEICKAVSDLSKRVALETKSQTITYVAAQTPIPENTPAKDPRALSKRETRVLSKDGLFTIWLPWFFARELNHTEMIVEPELKYFILASAPNQTYREVTSNLEFFMSTSESPVTVYATTLRKMVARTTAAIIRKEQEHEREVIETVSQEFGSSQSTSKDSEQKDAASLKAMIQTGLSLALQDIPVDSEQLQFLTDVQDAIYVSADGVLVPQQKEKHGKGSVREADKLLQYTAVVKCSNTLRFFVGRSIEECLTSVKSHVLETPEFRDKAVYFVTDGEKALWEQAPKIFDYTKVFHKLDYYHFRKNVDDKITAGLRGDKDAREQFIKLINETMWQGNHVQAMLLLNQMMDSSLDEVEYQGKTVSKAKLKPNDKLNLALDYYKRNYLNLMPFEAYQMAGLTISSSLSEMSNEILVALRQKGDLSSWCPDGSYYLAKLSALKQNGTLKSYFQYHDVLVA